MKYKEWLRSTWRPLMAYTYMAVILFDFVFGPILWTLLQYSLGVNLSVGQWQPLTLQAGGVFHAAMGAVIGISAWTRGQEKLAQTQQDLDRGIE